MTYRNFLNNLSDEEYAKTIVKDVLKNMACSKLTTLGIACKKDHCYDCMLKLLQSEVEDIKSINK